MLRNEVNAVDLSNGKADKKKSKSKKSKDQRPVEPVAGTDWTWKEQVDLVKFTKSPIQASLLQLETNELNKLALEGFLSIMKYMGDYPMAKGQSEVDCVYTILMVSVKTFLAYCILSMNQLNMQIHYRIVTNTNLYGTRLIVRS